MLATYGSALAHPNGLLVLFAVRLPAAACGGLDASDPEDRTPSPSGRPRATA
ncbi:hypothetical protein [Streptomyces sp. NPDC102487]|uniref:hypothetical protein n=1 Tax=Streptomyces sp. NPDC102487 TaxID=3366182 RepID=UPI0037F97D4D